MRRRVNRNPSPFERIGERHTGNVKNETRIYSIKLPFFQGSLTPSGRRLHQYTNQSESRLLLRQYIVLKEEQFAKARLLITTMVSGRSMLTKVELFSKADSPMLITV